MKNVIFIVLLVAVIAGGYAYMNQTNNQVEVVSSEMDTMTETVEVMPAVESEDMSPAMEDAEQPANADSMITPADMSEEAQKEMYSAIIGYNQCMMQDRLEYHQQDVQVANIADKTLQICEPHLDDLAVVLDVNEVNLGLKMNMVNTMRSRAVRKLMGAVEQTMAGQAAAAANALPAPAAVE